MAWRIAICDDCGTENPAMIVLKNEIWLSIAEKKEILCYTCIEKRLNRKLTIDDLKPDIAITRMIQLGLRMGHGIIPSPPLSQAVIQDIAKKLAETNVSFGTQHKKYKTKQTIGICASFIGHVAFIETKTKPKREDVVKLQNIICNLIIAGINQAEQIRSKGC